MAVYVANNALGITNYQHVPLPSSRPVEKTVDITICRRFKLRGMSRSYTATPAAAAQRHLG